MDNASDRVLIFDTTLRDGEQSPGISLNASEKLEIAQQLARLGVDVIEAGFPIASPGDFEAVQGIARQVEGPVIAGLARTQFADIESAANAVKDAARPRIHTFISTSDIHIVHQLQTTREDVLGQARAAVAHARGFVEDVEFSPMDATRSEIEFTAEVVSAAIEEGATTINIPDTVGYAMPHEYAAWLERLYELVPALGDVVLSVHCHDDLGLAVANSFAGVRAGARQVECAINGIGERAGNASLEEIVMLLHTRAADIGLRTGINTREIARTSRLVSRLTGYVVQPNKAIVGRNAFAHESGIHQDGVLKERTTYEIMEATSVGLAANSLVLGKHSGRHALRQALENLGIGGGARMWLHIGELAAEQSGRPLDRQPLGNIHELAAAVVALARQTFGVFVGENGPLRLENCARNDVLRGDQFDFVALSAEFELDRLIDLRVHVAQGGREQVFHIAGRLVMSRLGARRRRHHILLAPGAGGTELRATSGISPQIAYRPPTAKHWHVDGALTAISSE